MSKFFAAPSDESSYESSEYSDEEVKVNKDLKGVESSDEDTKRVVKSHKDKRLEEIMSIIEKIKNKQKIIDMSGLLIEFETMTRCYDKSKNVFELSGVPTFYTRCLVQLEDFINDTWNDKKLRETFSKTKAKGLAALRQKSRKYFKNFSNEMEKFRLNPVYSSEEELEQVADESNKEDYNSEESSEEYTDDSSDGSWESSDNANSGESSDENLAARFLKKSDKDSKPEKKKLKKERKEKRSGVADSFDWAVVKHGMLTTEKPKMFEKDAVISLENVLSKINELLSSRFKKSFGEADKFDLMTELREIASSHNLGETIDLKILLSLIICLYDQNKASYLKSEYWQKYLNCVENIFEILNKSTIKVSIDIPERDEEYNNKENLRIKYCLVSIVEQFDEELNKILQAMDQYSVDYINRLKDDKKLVKYINDLIVYFSNEMELPVDGNLCRTYYIWIRQFYFKKPENDEIYSNFEKYAKFIYNHDCHNDIKVKTALCHIYFLSVSDKHTIAKEMLLMSHLQHSIINYDISIQVMYNRALVQFALSSFRHGCIMQAHTALVDMMSGMRIKELLSQGISHLKYNDKTTEQETIEKKRILPYHLHINLEIVESIYLICAVLIETQYMASKEFDLKRRTISRNFHYILKYHEKQLPGPVETIREHVVQATKHLRFGCWQKCYNLLVNDYMDKKIWNLFEDSKQIKEMLKYKIKEQALRVYLFSCLSCYENISLEILSGQMQLDFKKTYAIVAKMILNDEISASLDQPSKILIVHQTTQSDLHIASLQLSERLHMLCDINERLCEQKVNGNSNHNLK